MALLLDSTTTLAPIDGKTAMPRRVVLLLWLCAMAITAPARADKADNTLRVVWSADGPPESADFYFSTKRAGMEIASLVWDTLVWRDPADFTYKPLLATAWRRVNDTTLEFDLRDDVTFQDGIEVHRGRCDRDL